MNPAARLPLHRLQDEDIEQLLASGERRAELLALFGTAGYRELSALAAEAAAGRRRGAPVVYVLPGLVGSRTGTRGRLLDDVLWLDLVEIAGGHLTRLALPRGARLTALGVMLLNSLKLKLSLQVAGFDARFHAHDWSVLREIDGIAGSDSVRAWVPSRWSAEPGHLDVASSVSVRGGPLWKLFAENVSMSRAVRRWPADRVFSMGDTGLPYCHLPQLLLVQTLDERHNPPVGGVHRGCDFRLGVQAGRAFVSSRRGYRACAPPRTFPTALVAIPGGRGQRHRHASTRKRRWLPERGP